MLEYTSPQELVGTEIDAATLPRFPKYRRFLKKMIVIVDNEYDTSEGSNLRILHRSHYTWAHAAYGERCWLRPLIPVWKTFGHSIDSYSDVSQRLYKPTYHQRSRPQPLLIRWAGFCEYQANIVPCVIDTASY